MRSERLRRSYCITVSNFVEIAQITAEIWRFFNFPRSRLPLSWTFKFFLDFNGRNAQDGHTASACQILSKSVKPQPRYGDFSIPSRWRPSAILDLWCVFLDHPRRTFGSLYHCGKFGWNRYSSFNDMQLLLFRNLGLTTPIHAPQIGFLGNLTPKCGVMSSRPSKGTSLRSAKTRHMTYRSSKSVHKCGLGAIPRIKSKKEKGILRNRNRWQVTCSPKPPTISQRHMDLHVWWYTDVVIYSTFRSPWGSKFAHSLYFGYCLIQQLALYLSFSTCLQWRTRDSFLEDQARHEQDN